MQSARTSLVWALAACAWATAPALAPAAEPLGTGDTVIVRQEVNIALHVPPTAAGPHGPYPILVLFGGQGDSIDYYPRALTSTADDLDLIVVVPQMPCFAKRGAVDVDGVFAALDGLRQELQARFATDPELVIVSGASAGGASACLLAKRWADHVPLLVLHSTWRCVKEPTARSVLLVGEDEIGFLGEEGRDGSYLGQGGMDLFAVPKEVHEVHFRHLRWWLETELAALRLERAPATQRAAEARKPDAPAILRSTRAAAHALETALPETDDFLKYQNRRRQALRQKYQPALATLQAP